MMGGFGGYGYGMGGEFGWVFMVLWWILIVVGIVALVKWAMSSSATRGRGEAGSRSLDILKERYARGEIDDQEFQKRKRDLAE